MGGALAVHAALSEKPINNLVCNHCLIILSLYSLSFLSLNFEEKEATDQLTNINFSAHEISINVY